MQNTYDFFNGIDFKNSIENCEFHDNNLNSVLSIQNSENLKIINSNFSNNLVKQNGVILLKLSFLKTIFEIAYCVFQTNDSPGGAFDMTKLGNLSIIKCEFLNNSALYSGAMTFVDPISIIIADSLFLENKSPFNGNGGAMDLDSLMGSVFVIIIRSNFSKNVANNAAAISLSSWSMFSLVKITDCFFAENNSTQNGGALLMKFFGDVLIKGNIFSNNFANCGAALNYYNACLN